MLWSEIVLVWSRKDIFVDSRLRQSFGAGQSSAIGR